MIKIDDKEIESFFRSIRDTDRDLLIIEDFKDQLKKVQGKFSEVD